MIPVRAALRQIHACIRPTPSEEVALADAAGRVLAAPVRARRSQPPLAVSAMDGYAIRSADLSTARRFRLVGEVRAGSPLVGKAVNPGETMRIFTGAPLPAGADRVIVQEQARIEGGMVMLDGSIPSASFVRAAGIDFKQGFAIDPPKRLTPTDVSLIAAMNHDRVTVARQPRVAILPTGDELRMPGTSLADHEIVASNVFGLHAMIRAAGGTPILLPIAADSVASITEALASVGDADLIITIGGASVGAYDMVRTAADDCGLELAFHRVAMRPGKPTLAGMLGRSLLIGLPGNPVSALVCGVVFVRPAVLALQGLAGTGPSRENAALAAAIGANGGREHYARAWLEGTGPDSRLVLHAHQDSSLLSVLGAADALAIRPTNDPAREIGERLDYIPLKGLLN